jgi:hypothetical protein
MPTSKSSSLGGIAEKNIIFLVTPTAKVTEISSSYYMCVFV